MRRYDVMSAARDSAMSHQSSKFQIIDCQLSIRVFICHEHRFDVVWSFEMPNSVIKLLCTNGSNPTTSNTIGVAGSDECKVVTDDQSNIHWMFEEGIQHVLPVHSGHYRICYHHNMFKAICHHLIHEGE